MLLKHIYLQVLSGAAASVALAAGVSLVSILQADDWARVSQDSVQHAVLGLSV